MVRRLLTFLPPASGAAVMGTGIVSVALWLDGARGASEVLLWITAAMWAGLTLVLVARLVWDRARLMAEATLPASLTGVAGSCVLGSRLLLDGAHAAAAVLLACALVAWGPLLAGVLRHWRPPVPGGGFLIAVATQALAVLAAELAGRTGADWLVVPAVVGLAAGLALYALALASFDLGQLLDGHGDHWVAGGALAISALAAGEVALSAPRLPALAGAAGAFGTVAVVLWALAMAWLPVLVAAEVVRPRLGFDRRRWATVFPLGMYAAMSFVVGAAAHHRWMIDFARGWVWVAVAVWALVLVATVRRAVAVVELTAR